MLAILNLGASAAVAADTYAISLSGTGAGAGITQFTDPSVNPHRWSGNVGTVTIADGINAVPGPASLVLMVSGGLPLFGWVLRRHRLTRANTPA